MSQTTAFPKMPPDLSPPKVRPFLFGLLVLLIESFYGKVARSVMLSYANSKYDLLALYISRDLIDWDTRFCIHRICH